MCRGFSLSPAPCAVPPPVRCFTASPGGGFDLPPASGIVCAFRRGLRYGFFKVHNSRGHTHSRGDVILPSAFLHYPAPRVRGLGLWCPSFPGSHFSQCGAAFATPSRLAAWGMISTAPTLRLPGSDFVHPLLGGGVCVLCSAVKVHAPPRLSAAWGAASPGLSACGLT